MDVSVGSPTDPSSNRGVSKPVIDPGSIPTRAPQDGGSEADVEAADAGAHELSSTQAAAHLGISKPEFRRREKQGRYRACRVNARGHKYYDVRSLGPAAAPPSAFDEPYGGVTTRARAVDPANVRLVFKELETDENLVRIVLATDLPPAEVMAIHASWTMLHERSGGFHVSRPSLNKINALGFDGLPARSERELVAALVAIRDGLRNCERCHRDPRRPGTYCGRCHKEVAAMERAEIERDVERRIQAKRGGRPRSAA